MGQARACADRKVRYWLPYYRKHGSFEVALGNRRLCAIIFPLTAQTNDWTSVEKLAPGTPISVVKRGRENCRVPTVTAAELACNHQIGKVERRLVFTRNEGIGGLCRRGAGQ